MSTASTQHRSTWSREFHALMGASLVTGIALALSASDFGAVAPLLIVQGLCMVLFALVGEACCWMSVLVGRLLRRHARAEAQG